ncbi:MAG: insulinase family protein [Litorimonas sp.]
MRLTYLSQVSVIALIFLSGCKAKTTALPSIEDVSFAHMASDLPVDTAITYGELANGLRYAVRENDTPTKTATLLMRIDTGSINETDETRGLAHFLEHMAFNGSENIPEGEMTKRLERFGLAFGADTNASTGFNETTYQLELPDVSEEMLDETLGIMRETAERLLLDPEAIDKERGVIQAERRARSNPAFKAFLDRLDFYAGHTILPDRLPIGTESTIDAVTPEQFRDFYKRYYRPEKTFITLVGDMKPELAIQKIEEYFGDWVNPEGVEAGINVKIDSDAITAARTRIYTDPEIQTSVSLAILQPVDDDSDTAASRKEGLIESLGNRMLNRRLGKMARMEDSAFISAGVGRSNFFDVAEVSSLSVNSQPDNWDAALAQGEQALRQALEYGFSQAELDEQLANIENSLQVSVQTSPTRRTPRLARQIMGAFGNESVVTTPQTSLERFTVNKPEITLDAVTRAFREGWAGLDAAPQLYMQNSITLEDGEAKLEAAYAASRAVPVQAREEEATLKFAYDDFGPAGKVVDRSRIEDLDATLVVFENNVRLNMKKTDFEDNVVRLSARVGAGTLSAPTDVAPGFETYASNMLALSGLGQHKVDDIATIMAGKSVGVRRGLGSTATTLSGSTTPDDLSLQLKLMAAYATDPGYRPEAQSQYDKYIKSWYPTLDSTPSGVASRDVSRILRSGDTRWGIPEEAALLDVDFDLIKKWMDENVQNGAIELTVVGDFEEDELIDAVAASLGALPERPTEPYRPDASLTKLEFPAGSAEPITLTHAGDAETARLYVYWPAPDASDSKRSRETQVLADLFQLRLTEVLREDEGATYSPGVSRSGSRLYPDYGFIGAQIEVSPDRIDSMADRIREVAAEFQAGDINPDVFERAIKPTLESLETSLESNGLWMSVLSQAQTDPEPIARFRTREATYQNMTVEDMKPIAEQVFNPLNALEIQILPE